MTDCIACVPVDAPGIVAVGSTRARCSDCGAGVWIAPSGVRMVAEKGLVIVCIPCVHKRMAADPNPKIQSITPEQAVEAMRTMGLWQRRN